MKARNHQSRSLELKIYIFSYRAFQKLFLLLEVCFQGFWLGTFKRETLHLVDQFYYDNSRSFKDAAYLSKAYNQRGLWEWEQKVIDQHFQSCQRLLVLGAGGGREVIALARLGYQVEGLECNPRLVEFANQLLQELGFNSSVKLSPRDQCLSSSYLYDGVIIGWGVYMLIQGREYRIKLLKHLRQIMPEGSPILLSFFVRDQGKQRYYQTITAIANTTRFLLRREFIEPGDMLAPNFFHRFIEEEISNELDAAGLKLKLYCTDNYGHAVGITI